jgi:hypothetical protein
MSPEAGAVLSASVRGVSHRHISVEPALKVDEPHERLARHALVSAAAVAHEPPVAIALVPSLSTSGETLTIEESMTLRARTENAGHVGVEHEWSGSR